MIKYERKFCKIIFDFNHCDILKNILHYSKTDEIRCEIYINYTQKKKKNHIKFLLNFNHNYY